MDYKVQNKDNHSFSEKNYINKIINSSPKVINNNYNNYNTNNLSEMEFNKS